MNLSRTHKGIGSLAVGAFDLVNCSLSVVGFAPLLGGYDRRLPLDELSL